MAIGTNAHQYDVVNYDYGDGGPLATLTGGIAIGNNTMATGNDIVIGDGLKPPLDGIRGSSKLVIGGLNNTTGQVELRRVVGMAGGTFATDGANLGQVWQARDEAIDTAASYTDWKINGALVPVNYRLASHDKQIAAAAGTASAALRMAQETQEEVGVLNGRVDRIEAKLDGLDKRINAVGAMSMAAVASINSGFLAPRETGIGMAMGGYKGQAAIAATVKHVNASGQTFTATLSSSAAGGTAVGVGAFIKFN
ncbi:MAG: hypothetical protein ACD_23C00066G0003 [uncultured bacterium]|nr:MAG: hypothetical protein ACD_23C00066G0003 [uncultured bacterium]